MVNIPAILIANGAALLLLVILLMSSHKTVHLDMLDHRLFLIMVFFAACQAVVETLSFLIDGRQAFAVLIRIFNSLLYCNSVLFALTWAIYADYKLFGEVARLKRIYPYVAIPALLVCLGSVVNLFVPVYYEITPDFVYQRRLMCLIPYGVNYLYLAYGVFIIYFYRRKVNKYLFMPAIIFMIPIILSSVLQYLFYGISLMWLGTAIAVASLYINVQNEVSYIDPLSGLFTRQYLTRYLAIHMKEDAMVGIMLDIDHFKRINDTLGHLVGDEAIGVAGKVLRSAASIRGMVARYAGDEFIIICPNADLSIAESVIRRVNHLAEHLNSSGKQPYCLSFSCGYDQCLSGDTIESFLKRLDAAMYEDKKRKQTRAQLC